MISHAKFLERAIQKERSTHELASQDFSKINKLAQIKDEDLLNVILDLKILRLKKVMCKYNRAILSFEQAQEIWGT
jgi:hypothetical protein